VRIVGIDPSLTGTGLAILNQHGAWVTTIMTTGRRGDGLAERDHRIRYIVNEVLADDMCNADLAVIEGPAITRNAGSAWDRAGLWWRIVHRLLANDVPVAVCPPSTRAKWATGRGNADKAAVAVAVARMWPDVELTDDNQADALALASMGAQRLGLLPTDKKHHTDALAAVAWPETWED